VRTAPPRCSLSGAAGGSLEWRACGGLEGGALARHVATLLGEQSGELRRTAQRSENRVLLHPVGSAPAAGDRARERRQRLVGVLLLRQHAGCAVLEACRLTALFADGREPQAHGFSERLRLFTLAVEAQQGGVLERVTQADAQGGAREPLERR
jgi:hypothetical protein